MKKACSGEVWKALLWEAGLAIDEVVEQTLMRHGALVRDWNKTISLVSKGDEDRLDDRHLVDSLSLAPLVRDICGIGGRLLDIGSGGGYPAIPIKAVLPDLEVILVERSVRKAGFLRNVLGALGLRHIEVVVGEFPRAVEGVRAAAITARAVDRPARVLKALRPWVEEGAVCLYQSGELLGEAAEMFHVEPIEDEWSRRGLRRGRLSLLRRQP